MDLQCSEVEAKKRSLFHMEKRPYRSVKEAVALYGQMILAPELYANVLQQMGNEEKEEESKVMKMKSVKEELDVAKQKLERAKERSVAMARSLSSLQEEVKETKRKLQTLKQISNYDIQFVAHSKTQSQRFEEQHQETEINGINDNPSMKKNTSKKKKKKSILFIRAFFSKNK